MSNFVPKPNTGILWPNDKKSSPNHPDVRGDVSLDRVFLQDMIDKADGDLVKLSISGWKKTVAGKSALSLSVSAPYVKPSGYAKPRQDSDDVPF